MPASASIAVTAMAMPYRPASVGDDDGDADDQITGTAVASIEIAEALDDVGRVAGGRGLGDGAHRAVVGAGVVLGDP